MSKLDQQFRVRLPMALHQTVSASAEQNHRSLNMEVIARLEASYEVGEKFPPEMLAELKRFAAKARPPTTARALALRLIQDGLDQLRFQEETNAQNEREYKANLGGLTPEQWESIEATIATLHAENEKSNGGVKGE